MQRGMLADRRGRKLLGNLATGLYRSWNRCWTCAGWVKTRVGWQRPGLPDGRRVGGSPPGRAPGLIFPVPDSDEAALHSLSKRCATALVPEMGRLPFYLLSIALQTHRGSCRLLAC